MANKLEIRIDTAFGEDCRGKFMKYRSTLNEELTNQWVTLLYDKIDQLYLENMPDNEFYKLCTSIDTEKQRRIKDVVSSR